MEVKFRISVKSIELSNFLLAEAVRSLKAYPERMKELDLSEKDLELIEEYRKKSIKCLTDKRNSWKNSKKRYDRTRKKS